MKTIKFTAFLFYRYYSTGTTKDIPYFSTLCAMAMIAFMHLYQVFVLTNLYETIIGTNSTDSRLTRYFIMAIVALPLLVFIRLLINESEIKNLQYPQAKIKKGNVILITYLVITIVLLIAIAELKRS